MHNLAFEGSLNLRMGNLDQLMLDQGDHFSKVSFKNQCAKDKISGISYPAFSEGLIKLNLSWTIEGY